MKRLLPALALLAAPALAQEGERPPARTRVTLGPQIVPSYPGSDSYSISPFVDVDRARGDDTYAFEAPDESFGIPVIAGERFEFGPSLGFQGKRDDDDVGAAVPDVGFTVEAGAYASYFITPAFRLRGEVRQGIGGHKGLIANLGADYVVRQRDEWLLSIGPRVTLANSRYQRAYFGVSAATAVAAGLPAFDADGGVQAVGATVGAERQLGRRWGVTGYGRYDRLVADAADSPLVRRFGSRDQFSAGVALSYTFGGSD